MADKRPPIARIAGPEDFAAAFNVSRESLDRLTTYAQLLVQWQKTINLVAPSTLDDIWHRHFADSAQILELAPVDAQVWADIGSGGGFPGLVIAILLAGREALGGTSRHTDAIDRRLTGIERHAAGTAAPDTRPRLVLIESDSRKCAFLAEVVRKTGISRAITVEILNRRIENPEIQSTLGRVDVISARALAPLERLLAWSVQLMAPKTVALFLKGRDAEAEIRAAEERWRFTCESWPSRTDPAGKILRIQHVAEKQKDERP